MMSTKYTKEELIKLILVDNISYEEIGRKYNISGTAIKKAAKRFEIQVPIRKVFPINFKPANKGTGKKLICLNCQQNIELFGLKYCSRNCEDLYKHNLKYKDFIENNDKYCSPNYSPTTFKPDFLKEQNYQCAICNMNNNWNSKDIIFILDHIDGNAANNKRGNLRLVCPNCDTQLPTFKSRNRNSARKERYLRNYKN